MRRGATFAEAIVQTRGYRGVVRVPSLHFGNQAAMVRGETGPKALWLCVTDFRRVCRFEKHLLVGAETPKNVTHRWVGC